MKGKQVKRLRKNIKRKLMNEDRGECNELVATTMRRKKDRKDDDFNERSSVEKNNNEKKS